MLQIIIILIIFILFLIVSRVIYMKFNNKKIIDIISKEELKEVNLKLNTNKEICVEILKSINNGSVDVILNEDKKSNNSFYNVFNNKIVLCDNEKVNNSCARLLFISHECQHSKQDKKLLWTNFIFANINIIYFFLTSILIVTNIITSKMYLMFLSIFLIINIFSYLARYIIEADATYMSLNISRKYAEKYLNEEQLDFVMKQFENIISNGFSTFVFGIFLNNIPMILMYIILIIIKYI